MAWDKWAPSAVAGANSPCATTVQITSNWKAIEDWWGIEHATFTSTKSGMHSAGVMGAVLTATQMTTIKAVSSPGTGALAWAVGNGTLYIYRSTNAWSVLTESHYSRVLLKNTTGQSLPSSAWTQIAFDIESYDGLGEYNAAGPTLAVSAEGFYLIQASVTFPPSGNYEKAVGIYLEGTRMSDSGGYGIYLHSATAVDILSAAAEDEFEIYAYNGSANTINIESAEVSVTRVS